MMTAEMSVPESSPSGDKDSSGRIVAWGSPTLMVMMVLLLSAFSGPIAPGQPFDRFHPGIAPLGQDAPPAAGATNAVAGSWTNLTSVPNPGSYHGVTMAYDSADGYVVAFGGYRLNWSSAMLADNYTWTYKAGVWTNITLAAGHAPPASSETSMAWDALDGYLLLFGGLQGNGAGVGNPGTDTWSFVGGHWAHLSPTCRPASCGSLGWFQGNAPAAFDVADNYVVVLSGGTWTYASDVWNLLPSKWANNTTKPMPRPIGMSWPWEEGAYMAYDQADREAVLYYRSSTWLFSGGNWTNATSWTGPSPSPRAYAQTTYDTMGGFILLVGGCSWTSAFVCLGGPLLSDTWSFSGGRWTNLTGGLSPPPLREEAFAFDASVGSAILFGGADLAKSSFADTDGTWAWGSSPPIAGLRATASPLGPLPGAQVSFTENFAGGVPPYSYSWRFGDGAASTLASPGHAYASVGYYTATIWVNDSASHSAASTVTLHVYVPLAVPQVTATPNPALFGYPVNFTSTESGGTSPYTYAWNFGDGGIGGNLQNITHSYTTNGPFMVVLRVTDSAGAVEYSYLNITIALWLSIGGNSTAGAAPLAVGFTSEVQGGVPAYSYFWQFGDGATSASAAPSHVYTTPGSYTATLRVNDSAGHTVVRSWNVSVSPGGTKLTVGIVATPSSISTGASAVVTATPSGGRGSYALTWSNVPSWCHPTSATSLKCLPTASGSFAISVEVVDSSGASSSASTVLTVTSGVRSSPNGFLGLPGDDGYLLLGGVPTVGVLAALLVARSRRSKEPPAPRRSRDPPPLEDPEMVTETKPGEEDPIKDIF